jgi:hypothetical protein
MAQRRRSQSTNERSGKACVSYHLETSWNARKFSKG